MVGFIWLLSFAYPLYRGIASSWSLALAAAWNRYKDTAELAKRYGQEEDAYYEELEKVRISSDPGSQT